MDHTQTVFLAHFIPMAIVFWIYCWYRSSKNKPKRDRYHEHWAKIMRSGGTLKL